MKQKFFALLSWWKVSAMYFYVTAENSTATAVQGSVENPDENL